VKHTLILAAFAAVLAAAPVQAQPVAADLLPAYEVATIVTSMGLRPVGRPAWRRGRYIVAAIDRYGREVNVVLDAHNGQVLAVRPLARESFGAPPPPPGYGRRPAPYDPMDGAAPPPEAGPGAPQPDDDEFFDNERQQGALPPPRTAVRPAPAPRDPAITGSVTRAAPVARRDSTPDANPRSTTPTPRPRPALARANDPGNKPVPAPADKPAASAKPDDKKPDAAKPEAAKPEAKPAPKVQAAKPDAKPAPANKPDQANKPDANKDVRVIDLGKPKAAASKPEAKPGEAIRF
jgi:hypothetical protein